MPPFKRPTSNTERTTVLRVGLNLANHLLVSTAHDAADRPRFEGIAPSIAKKIASRLGLDITIVPFKDVRTLTDAAGEDLWDIAFIASDPTRTGAMHFTSSYAEIPVTGLVHQDSSLLSIDDVDRPGIRVVSVAQSAFDLWLERNLSRAELVRAESPQQALSLFQHEPMDVLAGLKGQLQLDMDRIVGARMLRGNFTAIQQSIATPLQSTVLAQVAEAFVCDALKTGFINQVLASNEASGVSPVESF